MCTSLGTRDKSKQYCKVEHKNLKLEPMDSKRSEEEWEVGTIPGVKPERKNVSLVAVAKTFLIYPKVQNN